MLKQALRQIAAYERKIAALQIRMVDENRRLLRLPAEYGFSSMEEFITALQAALRNRTTPATRLAAHRFSGRRKPRAVVTPEKRQQVKVMVAERKTAEEIARALDLSRPTVQNIKKALGLVKTRH